MVATDRAAPEWQKTPRLGGGKEARELLSCSARAGAGTGAILGWRYLKFRYGVPRTGSAREWAPLVMRLPLDPQCKA